jgi:hypothetical protein
MKPSIEDEQLIQSAEEKRQAMFQLKKNITQKTQVFSQGNHDQIHGKQINNCRLIIYKCTNK